MKTIRPPLGVLSMATATCCAVGLGGSGERWTSVKRRIEKFACRARQWPTREQWTELRTEWQRAARRIGR